MKRTLPKGHWICCNYEHIGQICDRCGNVRPLFIPLKRKYFEAFAKGEKTTEYRPYGPRWNDKTCVPGRPVVLSLGYGKRDRLSGIIADAVQDPMVAFTREWNEVYGDKPQAVPFAIFIMNIQRVFP